MTFSIYWICDKKKTKMTVKNIDLVFILQQPQGLRSTKLWRKQSAKHND